MENVVENLIEKEEIQANKYVLRCCKISAITLLIVVILNELGIFTIEKNLLRLTAILGYSFMLCPFVVAKVKGLSEWWIKYVLMTLYLMFIFSVNSLITYHVYIIWGLPFFMVARYKDKKIFRYVYIFSIVAIFLSVIIAYRFGLADMNMVALTREPFGEFGKNIVSALCCGAGAFGVYKGIMFILGFIAIVVVGAMKLYALSNGVPAMLVGDNPYFHLSILMMILGCMLFLAGFLGELIIRNSNERNTYLIKEEITA